jgi:hypothetical protein
VFDFQDPAKADGELLVPPFALNPAATVFHQHFRRFGGVTVPEMDDIILPTFQPTPPVGAAAAVLDAFGIGDNFGEVLPMQVEM